MSDLEKTIAIIFSGVDEVSGTTDKIGGSLTDLSSKITTVAQPFANAADAILKFDAAAAALATGGLIYAFDASKNFESAVVDLQKVLGANDDINSAIAAAKTLSDTYGVSATSIIGAMAGFKQAGFDLADSLDLVKNSLDLVIAGDIDAAQSSELIISALKGFGLEASAASDYVDILNEVSNNYATDVMQLATGMSALSPIASQMGFSMAEAAGLLTPVIEIFRSGDEAANALKTGLLKLIDDSKPVADALAAIGVSQYDANGELRSGKDILLDVASAFVGLDENQKLFITSQLVGIEQSAKMVKVFDSLSLSSEITATALNSAGSAAKEVEQRLATAQVAVDRFKVGFENLAVAIGDEFRVAAKEAIDGGTAIENALTQAIDAGTFEPIFAVIRDFASELGDILKSIAENLPEALEQVDFSGLVDALGEIGSSIEGIFDGMDLSTPEGLADAIQSVVDTFESLARVTAGMVDSFRPFIDSVVGAVQSFNDMDDASKESAGNILGLADALVKIGPAASTMILALGDGADRLTVVFSTVINTVSGALDVVTVTWDLARIAFIEVLDGMLAASQAFASVALFGAFTGDIQATRDVLAQWKDDVKSDLYDAADAAAKHLTGIGTNFKALGESAGVASEDVKKVPEELEKIPEEKNTEIGVNADYDEITGTGDLIEREIPDEKDVEATVSADSESISDTKSEIESEIPETKETTVETKPDDVSISDTKDEVEKAAPDEKTVDVEASVGTSVRSAAQEIEQEIPDQKLMEIELQGNIDMELARIKAAADTVQSSMEWQAKVDIANIEAQAQRVVAAFEAAGQAVDATASATASMFSALVGGIDDLKKAGILGWAQDMVEEQMELQRDALDMQKKLTDAQIDYMNAKMDSMSSGEGLVQISSDGLEPELEMIMWKILEKVQIRVTEEAAEFLLGL